MKLTKHSQKNFNVILNFLLYAGLEEYTQAANDYIAEDHVDGEGSDEAILEIALGSELILEDIDITTSLDEDDDYRNIYANDINKLIYAVSNDSTKPIYIYKLTKPQEEIEANIQDKRQILSYVLARPKPDDEISLGDIFLEPTYVEKIYPLD